MVDQAQMTPSEAAMAATFDEGVNDIYRASQSQKMTQSTAKKQTMKPGASVASI